MKKTAILIMVLALICSVGIAYADDRAPIKRQADGSVMADGVRYSSLKAFHQSDAFRNSGNRCGTVEPTLEQLRTKTASTADCTTEITRIQSEYYPSVALVIPVYVHVIYASDGTGNVSEQRINDQIEVMNQDFRAIAGSSGANGFDTMIQFELAGITRTQNNTWFNDDTTYQTTYKAQLGVDQDRYMNIYTNQLPNGLLGYAYFPQGSAGDSIDGIVMDHGTIGGRDNGYGLYNQGRTLVHEAGHYFGLYHTFQGGCSNTYTTGDLLVDTNSEAEAQIDCVQNYTCGTADPIDNYMDYTPDSCMNQFTNEQGNRMVCSLINYRPNLFSLARITFTPAGTMLLVPID